ncbi:MAG: O-antigen ligase family protein [Verrucomicrobiota bacterium]|nr:O-antigen ligase family protein [Verrucomicrobiota bacterium]
MQPAAHETYQRPQGKRAIRRLASSATATHGIGFLASAVLILLSIILFCNLNGVAAMIWHISRAFSIVILALCLVALAMLAKYVPPSLRVGGWWLVVFYVFYTALGAAVAFQSPFVEMGAVASCALSYAASIAVILTYSAYGYVLFRSGRAGVKLMQVVLIICLISTLSVLLGIVYPDWAYITKSKVAVAGRQTGFFANPNELGIQGALTIVIGTFVTMRTGKIMWFSVAVLCGGIAAFYSFSKTAILMTMVVSVAMAFLIQRRGINLRNAFALIVSAFLVLAMISFVRGAAMRSESRIDLTSSQVRRLEQVYALLFQGRVDEETTTGRTLLFQEGLEMWKNSPLVGNGLTTMERMPSAGLGPHNMYIKVLGEGGLLCLPLMLAPFVRLAMHALKLANASVQAFMVGGLLVLNGAFMVSHNVLDDRNHNALMGLMCGMAAAAPVRAPRRRLVPRSMPVQPAPSYRPVHGTVR